VTARAPSPIAIDGPAASGKSSVGRALAAALGFRFLDTGLIYRAFALAAMRSGVPADDREAGAYARSVDLRITDETEARMLLGEEDVTPLLHNAEIDHEVSAYSRLPAVRDALRARQREFAAAGGSVLAGRDIGEVVLPDAPVKLYLAASEEARAQRRAQERGEPVAEADRSSAELARRDRMDSGQTHIAAGAIVIDTTALPLDEVIALALEKIRCAAN
jgi:cytidylate kinase